MSCSLLPEPRVTFSITHSFNKHGSTSHHRPGAVLSSHPFPDLSVSPVFAPVCLCLSWSQASALSPILLPALLVNQPLPLHIPPWAHFPQSVDPTPTILSVCPLPCFRGTCLDSGPLGGKMGKENGLRPCWVDGAGGGGGGISAKKNPHTAGVWGP